NGAGKTSLLRVMAGLQESDQGKIRFKGDTVSYGSQGLEHRRRVSMLHQEPYLFSGSVLKQVCYGPISHGLNQGIEEKARQALEAVGCLGLVNRHTRQLSGGEKKRIAYACLLALDSELLLLDEPTAQVDQESSEKIRKLIQMQLDAGKTLVVSTHQPEWAKPLKPRLCMLEYGRIVSDTRWN
ncbi:MAG TPA: ABC transporter ATP-binding protein, partial [Deltaproteobacteria bacterium]|nr:ABC transporter ATP-binding protein [Deltaproteobacteria bacterium]